MFFIVLEMNKSFNSPENIMVFQSCLTVNGYKNKAFYGGLKKFEKGPH